MMGVVIFVVLTITFFISHRLPGDPTSLWVGPHPTEEQLSIAREKLGLNQSMFSQYINYMSNIYVVKSYNNLEVKTIVILILVKVDYFHKKTGVSRWYRY